MARRTFMFWSWPASDDTMLAGYMLGTVEGAVLVGFEAFEEVDGALEVGYEDAIEPSALL